MLDYPRYKRLLTRFTLGYPLSRAQIEEFFTLGRGLMGFYRDLGDHKMVRRFQKEMKRLRHGRPETDRRDSTKKDEPDWLTRALN